MWRQGNTGSKAMLECDRALAAFLNQYMSKVITLFILFWPTHHEPVVDPPITEYPYMY